MSYPLLFAQGFSGGIIQTAIMIVVLIAVCALVAAFVRYSGINIPPILVQVIWIVLGAIIVILGILFIARVAGWA